MHGLRAFGRLDERAKNLHGARNHVMRECRNGGFLSVLNGILVPEAKRFDI